jgi:hypothetical protein
MIWHPWLAGEAQARDCRLHGHQLFRRDGNQHELKVPVEFAQRHVVNSDRSRRRVGRLSSVSGSTQPAATRVAVSSAPVACSSVDMPWT